MRLSVFGMGYVGCVSAVCFAARGHEVVGADVNPEKVAMINDGRSPIVEPGVGDLLAEVVAAGRLRATMDASDAVSASHVSLVCVGTPSHANGSLDLTFIKRACQQIGEALAGVSHYHIVAMRSTMVPGTVEQIVIPTLEVFSGKRAGRDFGVAIVPEFLREGTSLADFANPPFTLIGADDEDVAAPLGRLFSEVDAPVLTTSVREAEMVKYACNCFHALKVTFANEIGNICKAAGIDSHVVMDVFCRDSKLNLSPYYLKPGFAFGGSCLPKDLRAICYKARELDVEVPLLGSLLTSNRQQVERALDMVLQTGRRSVGVLGLSFKPGTDDLRESPTVRLIEMLIGKGLHVSIYDGEVELARLVGANKDYIENGIPHISSLMKHTIDEVVEEVEVLVIGKKEPAYRAALATADRDPVVIDLVRLFDDRTTDGPYQGMCW